ncbi:MAG: polyprenyl diphosphate synthase [Dehalogenimonas sp.]
MTQPASVPRHVAIIMDGNGRWATARGLPRLEGHRVGLEKAGDAVLDFAAAGVSYITLFSFSTENWKRPKEEVAGIMRLLAEALERTVKDLNSQNIAIRHLGSLGRLAPPLRHRIKEVIEKTMGNSGAVASFAFDYGGRAEIIQATRKLMKSSLTPDEVDEETFAKYLYSAGIPDVDLLIRTGGEMRLSNFLLWQASYAELYFTDTLWPDFSGADIEKALAEYARRQRRFGGL